MEQIIIPPLGEITVKKPRMSIIYDLVSTWSSEPSQAHIGRLSAAAIGICGQFEQIPKYDEEKAKPIAYGGVVLDSLLEFGVPPHLIVENGMELLSWLGPLLLTDHEIKKK